MGWTHAIHIIPVAQQVAASALCQRRRHMTSTMGSILCIRQGGAHTGLLARFVEQYAGGRIAADIFD